MLPLAPERAESHGFEYKRNGILSLFAALNTAPGEVISKTAARQASEQFVAFLQELLASQPGQREIHVMCDDVSSQKTELTQTFLAEHGQVRIQYTPAYSARLNQEENWFSRIRRDVIAHCLFTSVKDLDKEQIRQIRAHKEIRNQSDGTTTIRAVDGTNSFDSVDYGSELQTTDRLSNPNSCPVWRLKPCGLR